MNLLSIIRPFLKPTADAKVPTDLDLDYQIHYVSDMLHHLSPLVKKIVRAKIKLFFLYRWKYLLGRLIIIGIITTLSYIVLTKVTNVKLTTHANRIDTVVVMYPNDSSMNLKNYLIQIAYVESRYNKRAHRDSSQYLGLYQLGTDARRRAGYGDVPMNVFLNHPEMQDIAMINLLKKEKIELQKYIDKYDGKIVDGILITESGILALAHLGCGYAQSCLSDGIIPERDEFGNSPRVYAKLGGYRLNLHKVKYSTEDVN